MLKLHPKILVKDGKKHFAVLPYEEFIAIKELLSKVDNGELQPPYQGAKLLTNAFINKSKRASRN